MGHTSVAVTQVYAHLAPSELHSAVEKISVSLN
jgi:site-specific recombinase XerD